MILDWLLVLFLFGLLWGSFANVVIYRWPKRQDVIKTRSRCPQCKKNIKFYDNIPVLSWIFLLGKCRFCSQAISLRYPFVELLMGALFALLFYKFGFSWYLLELLFLCFGLVVVSFIDWEHMVIPDIFSLTGIVLGLVGGALNPEREFFDSLLGVLLGGGIFWITAYLYYLLKKHEGIGGGDIKLLAWIGAVLGWKAILPIIFLSSLLGSVVGLTLICVKSKSSKEPLPFGPYIVFASFIMLFWGDSIRVWYAGVFF